MSGAFTLLDYAAAGGAALAAGTINGVAGGGTLVSFPALVAIGVPAVAANVTNTVALSPGYLSGTLAARRDLRPQQARARRLAPFAALGGLAGAVLVEVTPESAFRAAVPWLVLAACGLLGVQDRVRAWLQARAPASEPAPAAAGPALCAWVLLVSVYGGFFGGAVSILLLAILGVFSADSLARLNVVKQLLALLINVAASACFALVGHVRWQLVPVMAAGAIVGGTAGSRLAQVVDPTVLRRVVVAFGLAVAVDFLVA